MIKNLLLLILLSLATVSFSQRGIGTSENGSLLTLDPSAIVEAQATTKGALLPRVALTATNVMAPIVSAANSLLVYNYNTAGAGNTAVAPGYYYWDTASIQWIRFYGIGKDSSEWVDGSLVGLTSNDIYANKVLNGGDTVVVTSNGRIGIGTTTPETPLDVNGSINSKKGIYLSGDNIGTIPTGNLWGLFQDADRDFRIWRDGYNPIFLLDRGGAPDSKGLGHFMDGRLRIGPANYFITGTPVDAAAILHVRNDGGTPYGAIFDGGSVGVGITSPTGRFHVSSDKDATIDSTFIVKESGNVGIGTINPTVGLDVYGAGASGAIRATRSNKSLIFNPNYTDANTHAIISTALASSMQLRLGAKEGDHLTIDTLGNVGVGTTTPGEKLHVSGGASFDFEGGVNQAAINVGYYSGVAPRRGLQSLLPGGYSNFGGYIEGGEVGQMVLAIRDNQPTDGVYIVSGGGDYVTDSLFDSVVMTAQANGNVGIGTVAPAGKFHVASPTGFLIHGNGGATSMSRTGSPVQYVTVSTNSASDLGVTRYTRGDGSGGTADITVGSTGANDVDGIGFAVGGTNTLWADVNGRVGVNQNNPTGRLHVANDQDATKDSVFIVKESGRVGIGTLNPLGELHIETPTSVSRFNTYFTRLTRKVAGQENGLNITHDATRTSFQTIRNTGTPVTRLQIRNDNGFVGMGTLANTITGNLQVMMDQDGTQDSVFIVKGDGSVGVGTINPEEKLHISGGHLLLNNNGIHRWKTTSGTIRDMVKLDGSDDLILGNNDADGANNVMIRTEGNPLALVVDNNGNVGIGGVLIPTKRLDVNGDIKADSLFLTLNNYADYVFEDYFDGGSKLNGEYKFQSLNEIETYIKENKHLPGVKSIKEVTKENGEIEVEIGSMSNKNLEKIEELYLHLIEVNKEKETLKKEVAKLKEELNKSNSTNDSLEVRLQRIEELLKVKE